MCLRTGRQRPRSADRAVTAMSPTAKLRAIEELRRVIITPEATPYFCLGRRP